MDRWWEHAACLGMPQEIFFPDHRAKPDKAKKICNGDPERPACPVRTQCLKDCLRAEIPSFRQGVWGGMSQAERKAAFGGEEVA